MDENEMMTMENTEIVEGTTELVPVDTACESEPESSGSDVLTNLIVGVGVTALMAGGYALGTYVIKPCANFCKGKWNAHKEKKAAEKAAKQEPVCEAEAKDVTPEAEAEPEKK